jgi:hypothetical protein
MIEFEINGKEYRAEKLDAFKQLHVSRKIAPLIPAMIPIFLTVAKMQGKLQDNLDALPKVLQPLADGLAGLSDDAAEYVIATCLSVVRRKAENGNWASVWNSSSRVLMFADIDVVTMTQLAVRIIEDNLGPFIGGLLTKAKGESKEPIESELPPAA